MKQKTMDILKYLSIGWCPKMAHNGFAMSSGGFGTTHYQNTTNDNRKHRHTK